MSDEGVPVGSMVEGQFGDRLIIVENHRERGYYVARWVRRSSGLTDHDELFRIDNSVVESICVVIENPPSRSRP